MEPRQPPTLPTVAEVDISRDTPGLTATGTFHVHRVPTGRRMRIVQGWFTADAAFPANGSNYFVAELRVGATVLATFSLAVTSLVAATPLALTLDTSVLCAAGADVTLVFTETGAATLPTGRLQLAARLV